MPIFGMRSSRSKPPEMPAEIKEQIGSTTDRMLEYQQARAEISRREKVSEVVDEQAALIHALNKEVALLLGINEPMHGVAPIEPGRKRASCDYCGRKINKKREKCAGCGAPYTGREG